MGRRRAHSALSQRHERVSNLVWGLMFIGLGGLLFMQQKGVGAGPRLSEHVAERAVDGDPETRWSSQFDDDEWLRIDLGASEPIDRVRLVWEQAHARVYEVRLSDDGEHWKTVAREEGSEGGTEEVPVGASGRYVEIHGIERATGYGFSLWEVEVYGPPGPDAGEDGTGPLLSRDKPATASSVESVFAPPIFLSFWFSWWPLFVIAAGLPHLLVPRSDGEELGGLVTVAVGVLFLLDNLDWTWRQAAPIVLVLAGFVVLTQGLRQAGRGEEDPPSEGPKGWS